MGGMVAEYPRNVYKGLFGRWSRRRYALGKHPYLFAAPGSEERNEDAVIAYLVRNLGPVGRDVGAVGNRLR